MKKYIFIILIVIIIFYSYSLNLYLPTKFTNPLTINADPAITSGNMWEGGPIAKRDNWIYYSKPDNDKTNSSISLYAVDLESKKKVRITNGFVSDLNIGRDRFFYIDYLTFGGFGLYTVKIDGTGKRLLKSNVTDPILYKNYIFYTGDGELNRQSLSNYSKKNLGFKIYPTSYFIKDNKVYFTDSKNGDNLFSADLDGKNIKLLLKINMTKVMNVNGNFYFTKGNKKGLYKVDLKNTSKISLINKEIDRESTFNIGENFIYIGTNSELEIMDLNGNFVKKISLKEIDSISVFGDEAFVLSNNTVYHISSNNEIRKIE